MKVTYQLSQFSLDPQTNVYLHPNRQHIDYSDGVATEEKLYQIISQVKDRSIFSPQLQANIKDWPSEYHFSSSRHNLLRHIHFQPHDQILELGCGCGAITRQLGETGAQIIAIEGSLHRAKIAALRCQDLPNVKIYCANFQDLDFDQTYNFVTYIGVLEYSPQYFIGNNPIKQALTVAYQTLNQNGTLIIAIENQLGLKYFCGFSEDHTGIPFYGLENRYHTRTPVTFGKYNLTQQLSQAGFISILFHYPYPDYKLPKIVLTDSAFAHNQFHPNELIQQVNSRDYATHIEPPINEQLVIPVLAKNHLLQDLSNSFLVFASKAKNHQISQINPKLLAVVYTLDRIPQFNHQTKFILQSSGSIKIKKNHFQSPTTQQKKTILVQSLKPEQYYKGKNLHTQLISSIQKDNFNQFTTFCQQYVKFIQNHSLLKINKANIFHSQVKPEYIDCLPTNIIIQKTMKYIDQEWIYNRPYKLIHLLIRALIRYTDSYPKFFCNHLLKKDHQIETLFHYLKIPISQTDIDEYFQINQEIYDQIYSPVKINQQNLQISRSSSNRLIQIILKIKKKLFSNYV